MEVGYAPIGNLWLREKLELRNYELTHSSYLGSRLKREITENGNTIDVYPSSYSVGEHPMDHLEFGLKYDYLNLDFLTAIFKKLEVDQIIQYIRLRPKGIYQRKVGFLYEFLLQQKLPLESQSRINYVDLLDQNRYVTGEIVKNPRWCINDNLMGNAAYCPTIRRTKILENALQFDFQKLIQELTNRFPTEVFHRAVNYLYGKETRSSYQIEKDQPTANRVDRFISILEKAGKETVGELLSESNLTRLQNEIVDKRYAVNGFRTNQNYIGQTSNNFKQVFHYICPPPQFVRSMIESLATMALKMKSEHPILQATAISFGFVFIHPFEDGNGRIHRLLIHDFLIRNQLIKKGMIIPVSAHMVNHIKEYDVVLEKYSRPLLRRITYDINDDQSIVVTNAEEVEGYFRYPDLTEQSIYLAQTIKSTITEDIYNEMDFLMKYDEVKFALQKIADIPDREIDLMIRFIHQNQGQLPKRRRKDFEKLTDDEIARMEKVFQEIFSK